MHPQAFAFKLSREELEEPSGAREKGVSEVLRFAASLPAFAPAKATEGSHHDSSAEPAPS